VGHEYKPYKSHPGGQAWLFGLADRALGLLSGPLRFQILQALAALITAVVLAAFLIWLKDEFGAITFSVALLGVLNSKWLTVSGRNLYWLTGVFFLPMLIMCLTLRRAPRITPVSLFWSSFWPMVLKCLTTGFEFITTTILMMTVPIVYYARRDSWSGNRTLSSLALAGAGACAAVVVTLIVVSAQVALYEGELTAGIRHIAVAFARRTHGDPSGFTDPELKASLQVDTLEILKTYLHGAAISTEGAVGALGRWMPRLEIDYKHLLLLLAGCSLLLGFMMIRRIKSRATDLVAAQAFGLIAATWWSVLAPFSWFVIFKAHSAIHTHIDFIVWDMPFTLWIYALFGFCMGSIGQVLWHRGPWQTAAEA
jgi:hypothetical protein